MSAFDAEQFHIAQQDYINLATERYLSSKKRIIQDFIKYELNISGRWI